MRFDEEIYGPFRSEFEYISLEAARLPKGLQSVKELSDRLSGDLIYAFKPRVTSYGIGLIQKFRHSKPLILDIEDFELAQHYQYNFLLRQVRLAKHTLYSGVRSLRGFQYEFLMDKLTGYADRITVVSSFLQQRYGGIRLPHGPDTNVFDPTKYDRLEARFQIGLDPTKRIILFTGMPRSHKGLGLLAEVANGLVDEFNLQLLLVGGLATDPDVIELLRKYPRLIVHFEPRPHEQMPFFLAAADLVVLAQDRSIFSEAQIPGKIFEAMAMAKPILASRVSDLPEILDGCGLIFEPADPDSLRNTLRDYLMHSATTYADIGDLARAKCVNQYSWDAMERTLMGEVLQPWL